MKTKIHDLHRSIYFETRRCYDSLMQTVAPTTIVPRSLCSQYLSSDLSASIYISNYIYSLVLYTYIICKSQ